MGVSVGVGVCMCVGVWVLSLIFQPPYSDTPRSHSQNAGHAPATSPSPWLGLSDVDSVDDNDAPPERR